MKGKGKGPISSAGKTAPAAKYPDASMTQHGGSVNNGATRGSTAKTPRTLGPRTA